MSGLCSYRKVILAVVWEGKSSVEQLVFVAHFHPLSTVGRNCVTCDMWCLRIGDRTKP